MKQIKKYLKIIKNQVKNQAKNIERITIVLLNLN